MQGGRQEKDLALAFQKGQEKAYDYFFRKYYASLCFFAEKLLRNRSDARDAVQDCFTKLWDRRVSLRDSETIKSFLYTTVYNASIDRLRKERKDNSLREDISQVEQYPQQEFLEGVIKAETIGEIFSLMQKLPTRMQQVFRMFYIEGKSYKEIADHFKTSPETVRKQKARALSLLRERLDVLLVFLALEMIVQDNIAVPGGRQDTGSVIHPGSFGLQKNPGWHKHDKA
jgi:RNA polymerase sigma-70 factor (family 1)